MPFKSVGEIDSRSNTDIVNPQTPERGGRREAVALAKLSVSLLCDHGVGDIQLGVVCHHVRILRRHKRSKPDLGDEFGHGEGGQIEEGLRRRGRLVAVPGQDLVRAVVPGFTGNAMLLGTYVRMEERKIIYLNVF